MAEGFSTIEDRINHYSDSFKKKSLSIPEIKKKLHPDYHEINWERCNNKMKDVFDRFKEKI